MHPGLHSKHIQNAFKLHSKRIEVALKVHSTCIQIAFELHSKCIQNRYKLDSKCIQHTFWIAFKIHSTCIQLAFKMHSELHSKSHANCIQFAFELHSGRTPKQNVGMAFRRNAKAKLWDSEGIPQGTPKQNFGILEGVPRHAGGTGSPNTGSGEPVPQDRSWGTGPSELHYGGNKTLGKNPFS